MVKTIKSEIRIIGWDDSSFNFKNSSTRIIGVICRAGLQVDGIVSDVISIDGDDVTEKIIKSVKKSPHYEQLMVIMLDGITFGGFNVADIQKIHEKTRLPVIVFMRKLPDIEKMKKALERFDNFNSKWNLIKKAGKIHEFRINKKSVYAQFIGLSPEQVDKIINITAVNSLTPEPLRIAHLIGSGIGGINEED